MKAIEDARERYHARKKATPDSACVLGSRPGGARNWQTDTDTLRRMIPDIRTVEQLLSVIHTGVFDHKRPVRTHRDVFMLAEQAQKFGNWPLHLDESPFFVPGTVAAFYGRRISLCFFWHLYQWRSCTQNTNRPLKRIIEVGGGYGALARLFFLDLGVVEYTAIDTNEVLFLLDAWLHLHFPDLEGLTLIPIERIMQADKPETWFRGADLVVNAGSFQEQTAESVAFWMRAIEAAEVPQLYSLNMFMNMPERDGMGTYCCLCPVLDPWWQFVQFEVDHPAFHVNTTHRVASIFLRRLPKHLRNPQRLKEDAADLYNGAACVLAGREEQLKIFFRALWLDPSSANIPAVINICRQLGFREADGISSFVESMTRRR